MESTDDIQKRHRTEQKNLQAKITQKKKAATKKTRKGIVSECEQLEVELRERQERERASVDEQIDEDQRDNSFESHCTPSTEPTSQHNVNKKATVITANDITQSLSSVNITSNAVHSEETPVKKRNRQKERLARRAAEREADIEDAKKEAAHQPNVKAVEQEKILEQCTAEGLIEKFIRPDGHCLFSAVADQLTQIGVPLGTEISSFSTNEMYKIVRDSAATYIDRHPDDFTAWLDEPITQYVEKIRNTAEWGGHLELLALARHYKVRICIIQDGAPQTIEPLLDETTTPQKIWMAYYRHGFGLGEHYNSLRSASRATDPISKLNYSN